MDRASAAARAGDARPRANGPRLRCAAVSHPGRVRERNEDRVLADAEQGLLVVVDGIGGEAGGEQAAETALALIRRRLERRTGSPEERIREAVTVANNEIAALASRHPEWTGMGCVLTVAVVEDGRVTVGHVGDSRLYALRRGRIEKVTRDHSPVGEREDRGELGELEAMRHPRRNEVYRSVGAEPHTPFDPEFIDVADFAFAPDDALVLCSDGLSDLVASDAIRDVVRANASDPRAAAEHLVEAALEAGGKDNVSVIVALGPDHAERWGDVDEDAVYARPVRPARFAGVRAALGRPGVAFALGVLAGAAATAALFLLARRDLPIPQPPAEPARSAVLRVGAAQRYRSIADALAAARAGDTVLVDPGVYAEQVRLGDGVSLIAAVPRRAVLVPTADGASAVVGVVAERLGSGAIRGIAVRASPSASLDAGIRAGDAAVTIDDVEVSGARLAGIVVEGRRAPLVRSSWIHDNPGAGILVRAGASAHIERNRIEGNGRDPRRPGPGIELERTARAAIAGNVIAGNAAEGVRGVARADRDSVLAANVFRSGGRSNRRPISMAAPEGAR